MLALWFRQPTPITASRKSVLLAWVGVLLVPTLLFTLPGCAGPGGSPALVVSGIVRAEDGAPVSGATVRVQTTTHSTTTGRDGRFSLSVSEPGQELQLTAWAAGYIIGGPVSVRPGDTDVELELQAHATADNPNYQWQSSMRRLGEGDDLVCANCHSAAGSGLAHSLPFDEWLEDAHANSARNPRFLTMYLGTDTQGKQSPPTQYVG